MRANFIDTLLARLDGEVATIWITVILRIDNPPDSMLLRRALCALVTESERLRVAWEDKHSAWIPVNRSAAQIGSILAEITEPLAENEAIAQVLGTRIDLSRDIPLRIHLIKMADPAPGAFLLAIQLHHSIGDAKAMGHLLERLWHIAMNRTHASTPLGPSTLRDRDIFLAALHRPALVPRCFSPERRLLAQRGICLSKSGHRAGRSLMATARFQLPPERKELDPADIFFASILAAVALSESRPKGIIRLRIPIDLRRTLNLGRILANACSAIAVEIPIEEARAHLDNAPALARLVRGRIAARIEEGAHFGTALECILVARSAPARLLRRNAHPGLSQEPRTNTLVVSYLGSLDRHFADAPFTIRSIRGHTPTWGATAFRFRDTLAINSAVFEGLWTGDELLRFTEGLAAWASKAWNLQAEILGP